MGQPLLLETFDDAYRNYLFAMDSPALATHCNVHFVIYPVADDKAYLMVHIIVVLLLVAVVVVAFQMIEVNADRCHCFSFVVAVHVV